MYIHLKFNKVAINVSYTTNLLSSSEVFYFVRCLLSWFHGSCGFFFVHMILNRIEIWMGEMDNESFMILIYLWRDMAKIMSRVILNDQNSTFLTWYRSLVLVLFSHVPVKFQTQSVTVTVLSKYTLETAESYWWMCLKFSPCAAIIFIWSYNTFKDDIQIYCRVNVINCFILNMAAINLVIIWYTVISK